MKKNILRAVFLLIILIIPSMNLTELIKVNKNAVNVSAEGVTEFGNSSFSLSFVEKRIKGLLDERARIEEEQRIEAQRQENYETFLYEIKNGKLTFRQAFSDSLIVGDSLMQGMATYRVLDSSNMISMVSASLYHLAGNVNKIIANNPSVLITHYGINMLIDSESYLDSFIAQYKDILTQLKNALPDTRIFVSGIFNVSPSVERSYSCISEYNERLKDMCAELEINYLDNSECLPGDGSYYGTDGIHVSKGFYTDVWLPHVFYEVYLK